GAIVLALVPRLARPLRAGSAIAAGVLVVAGLGALGDVFAESARPEALLRLVFVATVVFALFRYGLAAEGARLRDRARPAPPPPRPRHHRARARAAPPRARLARDAGPLRAGRGDPPREHGERAARDGHGDRARGRRQALPLGARRGARAQRGARHASRVERAH